MDISTDLPFDFCDRCKMFDLHARSEALYAFDDPMHSVVMSCANKSICINVLKKSREQADKQIR